MHGTDGHNSATHSLSDSRTAAIGGTAFFFTGRARSAGCSAVSVCRQPVARLRRARVRGGRTLWNVASQSTFPFLYAHRLSDDRAAGAASRWVQMSSAFFEAKNTRTFQRLFNQAAPQSVRVTSVAPFFHQLPVPHKRNDYCRPRLFAYFRPAGSCAGCDLCARIPACICYRLHKLRTECAYRTRRGQGCRSMISFINRRIWAHIQRVFLGGMFSASTTSNTEKAIFVDRLLSFFVEVVRI